MKDSNAAAVIYDSAANAGGSGNYAWLYHLGVAQARFLEGLAGKMLIKAMPDTRPAKAPEDAFGEAETILREKVLQGREGSPYLLPAARLLEEVKLQTQ